MRIQPLSLVGSSHSNHHATLVPLVGDSQPSHDPTAARSATPFYMSMPSSACGIDTEFDPAYVTYGCCWNLFILF